MAVSYKKLWKMLIDKDMKKKDLCAKAGISTASVTKMGKGGHVTTEVLAKICAAMDCGVDDIMEIVLDNQFKLQPQRLLPQLKFRPNLLLPHITLFQHSRTSMISKLITLGQMSLIQPHLSSRKLV